MKAHGAQSSNAMRCQAMPEADQNQNSAAIDHCGAAAEGENSTEHVLALISVHAEN